MARIHITPKKKTMKYAHKKCVYAIRNCQVGFKKKSNNFSQTNRRIR